jgi:long-chain acyl-CoA synthetase
VLGRPDPVYGEEVVAFVTVTGDVDEEALVAFARERLGGYKYPREIHVVDTLPLTPVGKADRKALRELLTAQGGART